MTRTRRMRVPSVLVAGALLLLVPIAGIATRSCSKEGSPSARIDDASPVTETPDAAEASGHESPEPVRRIAAPEPHAEGPPSESDVRLSSPTTHDEPAERGGSIAEGIEGTRTLVARLDAIVSQMRDAGLSREMIAVSHRSLLTSEAALRLSQLENDDPVFAAHLSEFRGARDAMLRDPTLGASEREAALDRLRERLFGEPDRDRIRAVETIDRLLAPNARDD